MPVDRANGVQDDLSIAMRGKRLYRGWVRRFRSALAFRFGRVGGIFFNFCRPTAELKLVERNAVAADVRPTPKAAARFPRYGFESLYGAKRRPSQESRGSCWNISFRVERSERSASCAWYDIDYELSRVFGRSSRARELKDTVASRGRRDSGGESGRRSTPYTAVPSGAVFHV